MLMVNIFTILALLLFNRFTYASSGKLLLTSGVSQIEGAAGGGLTPWALIGSYASNNQIGGTAFYTDLSIQDFRISSMGVLLGIKDIVELSLAKQTFDT